MDKEQVFRLGLILGGVVLFAYLIKRYVESTNKLAINLVLALALMVASLNWIGFRNEPSFLTPAIDTISSLLNTQKAVVRPERTVPN